MKIITISREFGSGGRELAKRLSDAMGIVYYDREILTAIAQKGGFHEDYVRETLEQNYLLQYPLTIGKSFSYVQPIPQTATDLLIAQRNTLLDIARKGSSCIIVGRCADVILRDYHPLRLFVYAGEQAKLRRCLERETDPRTTEKDILRQMRRIDKARASYYRLFAETGWGQKENYDLCINTTHVSIKQIVPLLKGYLEGL